MNLWKLWFQQQTTFDTKAWINVRHIFWNNSDHYVVIFSTSRQWGEWVDYCFREITVIFSGRRSTDRRSQWPRGLSQRSAAARPLGLWVRIPPGTWMSVCCECRVMSGRGLCDELITRLEESYRLWCVVVCDLETSWMRRPCPTGGCHAKIKKKITDLCHS